MIDYIQHVLEIEEIKKEADKLMMAKVSKYENEIAELKKELKEVKDDNKKLAKQIEDNI
jgi:septal ring factor EnvC (AmiA/AmiB activator)